jgi:hypothetical protein
MSGPHPIDPQRSPWRRKGSLQVEGVVLAVYVRRVDDGVLAAMVGEEPNGWHASVSFRDPDGALSRYPTWDELAHARYELLPGHLDFVMHLPPVDEYVAVHPTTFHLHEHPEREA